MLRIVWLGFALMFSPLAPAAVILPFYDPLNYSEGPLYSVGAGVWDAGGNAGNELTVSNSAALVAPSGLTNALGKGMRWSPSGTARRSLVQFSGATSGELYASFLINAVSPPSSGSRLVAYLDSSTSQPSSPQLGFFVGNGSFGIGKKSSTPGVTASIGSSTHFVVLRYTFTGTSSDTVDFWVDPASSSFGLTPPAASGSTSGGNNVASIPYFGIYAASGSGPSLYLDEVRLGTTWADVTPPSGAVIPPQPGGQPVFTESFLAPTGLVLRGTNGVANGAFALLASPDLALPVAQWSGVATQSFNASGNFDVTNPVPPATAQFYRLLRTSATNPPVGIPPSLTSQPQNQNVIPGQSALFSAAVTGTAPFAYQWYFNTNTALAGETNATLLLNNVQSNQAGVYFVQVSNPAGATNSSFAALTLSPPPTDGNFFVSPTGNDANPGTIDLPFATVAQAIAVAAAGDLIYVRGGTYFPAATINITTSGTAGNMIKLWAYPGEQPVLDFVNQPYGAANRGFVLKTNGNYWHFKGLEIARAGDNAIKVESSHCKFEELVLHHNGDTGLQIGFAHETINPGANLAAFIEVINCDSYLNYDPDSNGGDADGFAAKLHCGQGIVFSGCRAWENSDDSWDLFETDATVIITNCWGWKSGVGQGNGNGFKLGGNGTGGDSVGTHYAYNCVSFAHKVNCFTQNSHKDGIVVQHCLAFAPGNSGYNYFMEGSLNSGKQNIFRNNVSLPRSGVNSGGFIADNSPVEQNNTWNLAVTANASDYLSLLESAAKAPRNPDGSLPTGFARLVAGSDLIDKGVAVGIPFIGGAPDLGPYEWP